VIIEAELDELVCAVDLGGTNLRAANIDGTGVIHHRVRTDSPSEKSAEGIVADIVKAVRECEAAAIKRGAKLSSVAVLTPGSVQIETGIVLNAPNLPALEGFKPAPAIERALKRPVLIENDANAAALGEMWQGAARGCRTVICLTLGTGVGSGVVLDGKLWRGIDGIAGELGHTTVDPFGGVQCGCRNTGCLEVYASATAIVRMAREGISLYPSSTLHRIANEELTSKKVFDAATAGDELAVDVFRRMGTYLGIAMANFINAFNPEVIVIAGGVAAAWDLFATRAREEVMNRAFPVPALRCRILRAECGDDAGLLGAAWLALEKWPRTNLHNSSSE
jgi:glucokinase